jgi:hypothetical protein
MQLYDVKNIINIIVVCSSALRLPSIMHNLHFQLRTIGLQHSVGADIPTHLVG